MDNIKTLTRDDLYILLESYKNTIELNTMVVEQQKNLISQINSLLSVQKETCDNIDILINEIKKNNIDIINIKSDILLKCSDNCSELNKCLLDLQNISNKDHSNFSKGQDGIKNHLYVIYVALGSIVASMVGFIMNAGDKIEHIKNIIEKVIIK